MKWIEQLSPEDSAQAMSAPITRCYGWLKRTTDEYDPKI